MIRKTLTILSLVGLVASVGLWGISCQTDSFYGEPRKTVWGLACGCFLIVERGEFDYVSMLPAASGYTYWRPFYYEYTAQLHWVFGIPLYLLVLLFACPSFFLLRRAYRRRKRRKLGLCADCGYDLRASSEQCPECGNEFVSSGV